MATMSTTPVMRIRNLEIERFKSIKKAEIECRKVNVFIGEPDTGKTNILEALQFLSCQGWGVPVGPSLRLRPELGFSGLFHRQFVDKPFLLVVDGSRCEAALLKPETLSISWKGAPSSSSWQFEFSSPSTQPTMQGFRHYSFQSTSGWGYFAGGPTPLAVSVPDGRNMFYVVKHHEQANTLFRRELAKVGLRPHFAEHSKSYYMTDITGEELRDYSLEALSDSVKRLLFYTTILLTVDHSVIVMDEPDVFAFPPYPKTLGEMIAGDATNQFFLTTHNPYFLTALAEKTDEKDLGIFICQRDDQGSTWPVLLDHARVSRLLEHGPSLFFNLDNLLAA